MISLKSLPRILLLVSIIFHCVSAATVLECSIGADGIEVCGEKEIEEGEPGVTEEHSQESQEEGSSVWTDDTSEEDKNTLFWDGGTLVNSKIECLDRIDDCKEIIEPDSDDCTVDENLKISDALDLFDHLVETVSRCKVSCGVCEAKEGKTTNIKLKQRNDGTVDEQAKVQNVIFESVRYLHEVVLVEDGFEDMYKLCQDDKELCAFWASMNECKANPNFMQEGCMLSCKTCDSHALYRHSINL